MRNPIWTRDELILLLDTYFRVSLKGLSEDTPEVIELSVLLNQLPIHSPDTRTPVFRNPAGVHMKLRNLARFDPRHPAPGLRRGGLLEEVIWSEFSSDVALLHATAKAIRRSYKWFPIAVVRSYDEEKDFREGKLLSRIRSECMLHFECIWQSQLSSAYIRGLFFPILELSMRWRHYLLSIPNDTICRSSVLK